MNARQITKLYNQASNLALAEVEKEARRLMRKHKNLKEFVMAMGSYFFVDAKGETISTTTSVYRNYSYVMEDTFAYFKPLNEFMLDWEERFKITGEAMRFTAEGKKITDW